MHKLNKFAAVLILLASDSVSASADALFELAQETFGRISPDGSALAVVVRDEDDYALDVIELSSQSRNRLFSTDVFDAESTALTAMEWIDNDTLILKAVELTDGIAKLSDTRNKSHLFVIDNAANPEIRYIESGGEVVDTLPYEEAKILFARNGRTSIVYKVDTSALHIWGNPRSKTDRVDGGQFSRKTRVAEVDGLVIRWLTANSNFVRSAFRMSEDGLSLVIRENESDDWRVEKDWSPKLRRKKWQRRPVSQEVDLDAYYLPLAQIEDSNDFIVVAEDEDNRKGVYRYNYASKKKELIYQHPTAEFISVGLSQDGNSVLYISYFEGGVVKYHYVPGAHQDVVNLIAAKYPQYNVMVVAADSSETKFLVFLESSIQPGLAYFFDHTSGELTELFATMPWVDESELAPSSAKQVENDGLNIEYFLTVPRAAEKAPLVVYPHGGPWGIRDSRRFNPTVQYLVSRGFAILQVNFRGSGGYGAEFRREGYGEFGQKMLGDIEAAMDDVLLNPAIDSEHVCAVGESYGGYAAMMLAIRSPEIFRCVASFAGVSDLGLLLGSYEKDDADVLLKLLLNEAVTDDAQYEHLRNLSPLYRAEELIAPVFLQHGTDDIRVDIEHSFRMVERLNQLGKPVTWQQLDGHGHSFQSPTDALQYYQSLADFLESHLNESPSAGMR